MKKRLYLFYKAFYNVLEFMWIILVFTVPATMATGIVLATSYGGFEQVLDHIVWKILGVAGTFGMFLTGFLLILEPPK